MAAGAGAVRVAHSRVELTSGADWQAALSGVPHAFAHTWDYCRAMQQTSEADTFLYVFDDGAHRVICPFSVREFAGERDLVTPYGFAGFTGTGVPDGFAERWATFARDEGFVCAYVGLNPALAGQRYVDPASLRSHNSVFLLDLTPSPEALLAGMSVNRRRQARAWERGGIAPVTDRDRLMQFVREHLRTFLDARHAARVYYLSEATLSALSTLDDVVMVGAAVGDRLEAVSMFGHTAAVGDFLFNVSIPGGERHSAPLIWLGALELKARGVPTLNLGGGIRPGDGVAEFKVRFGGEERPLQASQVVFAPERFARLCDIAGVKADRDGFFPPYHRR